VAEIVGRSIEDDTSAQSDLANLDERIALLRAMHAKGEATDSVVYREAATQLSALHDRLERAGYDVVVPADVQTELGITLIERAIEAPAAIEEVIVTRANGKDITLKFERDASGKVVDLDMGAWKRMSGKDLALADKIALGAGIDMSEYPDVRRDNLADIRKYYAYEEIVSTMQDNGQANTQEYQDIFILAYKLKEKLLKAIPDKETP
jgi:hypothetical protein